MSNLVVSCTFTKSGGQPATGEALADIDITLTSVNKSNLAVAVIWNTENPTVEVTGQGAYARKYASADFIAYVYFATGNYTGGTTLDIDYTVGGVGVVTDEFWDEVMDANAPAACNTAREYMNVIASALAGPTADEEDWSAQDLGETKTRIAATLDDEGHRTSIDTLDGT